MNMYQIFIEFEVQAKKRAEGTLMTEKLSINQIAIKGFKSIKALERFPLSNLNLLIHQDKKSPKISTILGLFYRLKKSKPQKDDK